MKTIEVENRKVPALGLGTWKLSDTLCRRVVEEALEIGYRHIDTAQMYDNEGAVGRAVRESGVDRSEIFVTTKVWFDRLSTEAVKRSTGDSLERLGMDYVDLLLVHWPSEAVSLRETLDAFQRQKEEGRTRLIGVSNFTPTLVREAVDLAPIACNQIEYHPLLDQRAHVELAREHGYMITAYAPLARGEITTEPTLVEIGERHGKSAAQVCLRWLLQQDVVCAIPKASSGEHLRANFDVFDFELTDGEMEAIHGCARGERKIDPEFAPEWRT